MIAVTHGEVVNRHDAADRAHLLGRQQAAEDEPTAAPEAVTDTPGQRPLAAPVSAPPSTTPAPICTAASDAVVNASPRLRPATR